jgi:L-ascorbate metabolism protein UlaG (beta-lactamase superfamily)
MKIEFLGHSCVRITTGGTRLLIDPFLSGNPLAGAKAETLETDYILLTHAHADHITDAAPIALRTGATVIATFELATYMRWQGAKTHEMNLGGSFRFDFGTVQLVPAFHSSGIVNEEKKTIIYAGMPAGFVLTLEGKRIYHAGDTSLYSDMKLIAAKGAVDLAFLPIGDNYTMGPEDALTAAEWVQAKAVVPLHYNTFPAIRQDAQRFAAALQERGIRGIVLEPGQSIEL